MACKSYQIPSSVWQIIASIYGRLAVLGFDFVSHVGPINMIDSANLEEVPITHRQCALFDNCDSYRLDWGLRSSLF